MPKLSIIIPCYFNGPNIASTADELIANEKLFPQEVTFEYVMVDDGSKDNTLNELKKFRDSHPGKVKIIKLSGNFGSYNAILAGMEHANGDCNVVIAADLQDPVELIPQMYKHWSNGIKLVIANRTDRDDPFFAKMFARSFQFMIKKFALHKMPAGGFDFVLFDKKLKDEVLAINEKNTNSLYMLLWLNYEFISIPYKRSKRTEGKSRWTVSKKIKLFIDSFVSFSFLPIRIISILGLLLGAISLFYGLFIIVAKIYGLIQLEGWTTLMSVFLFVSSFQLIALGILGEYIWRTLDAARKRPNYIVDEVIS